MDRLKVARRTLTRLYEVLKQPKSEVLRDASIKRFEYTFEATWKAAQLFLREEHSLDLASPKLVFRAAGQVGLLNEQQVERALAMAGDRNLTVHTYKEELAETVYAHLPEWADLVDTLLTAMEASPQGRLPLEENT